MCAPATKLFLFAAITAQVGVQLLSYVHPFRAVSTALTACYWPLVGDSSGHVTNILGSPKGAVAKKCCEQRLWLWTARPWQAMSSTPLYMLRSVYAITILNVIALCIQDGYPETPALTPSLFLPAPSIHGSTASCELNAIEHYSSDPIYLSFAMNTKGENIQWIRPDAHSKQLCFGAGACSLGKRNS